MKKSSSLFVLAALLLAFCSQPAWPQVASGKVEGKITDNGNPVASAQITLASTVSARVYKLKTDRSGVFSGVGVAFGEYNVEIVSASGEKLLTVKRQIKGPDATVLSLDITRDAPPSAQPPLTKEQIEALKAQREKAINENALISQFNAALNGKDWQAAIEPLQKLVAMEPARWEYYQALGTAHLQMSHYEDAVAVFEKGISNAKAALAAGDPKTDPVKVNTALGQMLTNEGNAYLKLHKSEKAIVAYTKAAEIDPKPATAYFNICATLYNAGDTDRVVGACDKAIAADPSRADAYFIKGSVLYADSTTDAKSNLVPPPGAIAALKKYLELAPQGSHAADVKEMLKAAGAQ